MDCDFGIEEDDLGLRRIAARFDTRFIRRPALDGFVLSSPTEELSLGDLGRCFRLLPVSLLANESELFNRCCENENRGSRSGLFGSAAGVLRL